MVTSVAVIQAKHCANIGVTFRGWKVEGLILDSLPHPPQNGKSTAVHANISCAVTQELQQ